VVNINHIFLLGNLTRDPELKYTNEGVAITEMSIAVNKRWKYADGEENNTVDFFNITTWNHLAENCANSLKKGDRIFAGGHINLRMWENRDGKKFNIISITADVVGLSLEFSKKSESEKEEIKKTRRAQETNVKLTNASNGKELEKNDYAIEVMN